MILTVTGHRPPRVGGYKTPNPVYDAIMEALDRSLVDMRPELVITGMALGVDQWVAELCIQNDIPFLAAIPMDNFDAKWIPESRTHYQLLLSLAQRIHVVSPGVPYRSELMNIRNRWMVDQGDQVLAVYDGLGATEGSGTANTISYASRVGKHVDIVQLAPEVWQMASNMNRQLDTIKASREAQREERARLEQERQTQHRASVEASMERARQLVQSASNAIPDARSQREQEREERRRQARIQREQEERVRVAAERRMAIEREDEERLAMRQATIQARILREQAEFLRNQAEAQKEEEAKAKATIEHSKRLKPRRVIDI